MNILKKQLGMIIAYVILFVLLASPECAAENKTLMFVGNDSYPPISYQEGGKPKGLAIDIVRALGQRMGRQIDIRLMGWKVAQAMVAQGKADALCQLSITEARKQIYDFSDQAHDLRFSIFVRTGKQGISDLSDLRGLQVAVWTASVQHQFVMADSQINFTLIANDLQGFQLLKDGKVDAVLADLWSGSYVLADKGITGIQTSGEPFARLDSAIAVKKGNTALLAAINDGLRSLQADGTIERINEKWRPQEIIVQTREQSVRKTYYVIIGILGLLLVVGAFWLITLRREISERRRAETELSESRRWLTDLIEFLPDATLAINLEGRIIIWNKAIEEMTGIPSTEMIGKGNHAYTIPFYGEARPQLMDLVFEDKENIARLYPQITREGDTIIAEVFCNALYNNKGAWISAKASPLHDQSGKIIGAIESIRDITDRKRSEEALIESEAKYRTFVEKANEAIIIAQGDMLAYANPKMCEMLGKPLEALAGNLFTHFIHPDDRAMVVDRYKRRLAGEKLPDSYEFRILGKGDVIKWVYITATLVQWEGKPATLNLLTDVTDRKQAEQALIDSEERYRGIVENVIDVYYRSDKKGNIIMMSPSALSVLGYGDLSELVGKNVAEDIYLVPEDRKIFLSKLNREGEVHDFEVILKRKNGTPIPVSTSSRYYYGKDGSMLGVEGFFRDISERKRVEQEIKERQDMEKSILSSVPHGVFGVEHRKIFFANDVMETIFGWNPEELIGKSTRALFRNEEEWKGYGSNLYSMMAKETSTTFEPDIPFVRKDGTEIFCRNSISRFGDDLTEGNKIVATFEDITERKRAEKFQKELEEKLQRAEKMESLGTLAGGVAHDLNNVLGIVVGYAEMLMDELDEENPMRGDMKKILEGGNRSAAIVHDLLTLARRGVQTKKTVNLNATITDCQKLPEFEKVFSYNTQVKLQTDLELNLLNIMGSPVHLGKTIINLAANAVEAMPNGGVLKITTTNQYLDIPIHGYDNIREGDYVVLTVSDTGEGISERDIKRIFEPFYTKKIMGKSGTGLGLAVVWGTIKDHNGYINVESIEGKGTTFTLYFPVTREEITSDQISVSMSEYMGKGETILVVDDVNRQRELASRMLTKLNYIVNTVVSGEEAIEFLRKNKADLVVLDMIMDPGIDGLETYEKILEISPAQKAIIVSGFSESGRVKDAQRMGAGAYVPKPYVLERLGMAVRKELGRK